MVYIVRQCPTGFSHLSTETVFDSLDTAKKYACDLANSKGVDISVKVFEAADSKPTTKRTLRLQW